MTSEARGRKNGPRARPSPTHLTSEARRAVLKDETLYDSKMRLVISTIVSIKGLKILQKCWPYTTY